MSEMETAIDEGLAAVSEMKHKDPAVRTGFFLFFLLARLGVSSEVQEKVREATVGKTVKESIRDESTAETRNGE